MAAEQTAQANRILLVHRLQVAAKESFALTFVCGQCLVVAVAVGILVGGYWLLSSDIRPSSITEPECYPERRCCPAGRVCFDFRCVNITACRDSPACNSSNALRTCLSPPH